MGIAVETRNGRLAGTERKGIKLFRGIPYARPPVGDLRFRPPEAPESWIGTRDARRVALAAPQSLPIQGFLRPFIGAGGRGVSEDCLALNVWTPGCDHHRRPVMVWIHGGAFVLGNGGTALYSGRRLARRGDVVVVTLNYRLGSLGFLHLAELLGHDGPVATNLGLRDQVAALEWVRDHIDCFGGDPNNVTVFGESAGAMSIAGLLAAPRARPLFHRAILQSGAAHHISSSERATRTAEMFLSELDLTPDQAGSLRDLPLDALLSAQRRTALKMGFAQGTLPWQPAVDGDLIPKPPLEALAKGDAAGIPVLIGTNLDEWKLFTLGDSAARKLDEKGLLRRLERALPGTDADGVRWSERAVEVYRRARLGRGTISPWEIWVAFQSDRIFRHPATRIAELQAPHEPRTYSYLFDWSPAFLGDRLGACHGLEIPFVFGTLRHPVLRPFLGISPGARTLARTLQKAWIAFAHTGDPSSEGLGIWPGYTPDERATMILGDRCFPESAPLEDERSFWEEIRDNLRHA